MDEQTAANDELRISIEAGENYPMTPRLSSALEELEAALQDAEENDTGGFGAPRFGAFSFNYSSPTMSISKSMDSATPYIDKSSPDLM